MFKIIRKAIAFGGHRAINNNKQRNNNISLNNHTKNHLNYRAHRSKRMNSEIKENVGFCGFGVMGSALAKGLQEKYSKSRTFYAYDPYAKADQHRTITFVSSNLEIIRKQPKILFLATKPQYLAEVCKEIRNELDVKKTLVVSIAAGITTTKIEEMLPDGARVVRCMPNVCCTVGSGAAGACAGKYATTDDLKLVVDMMSTIGTCVSLPNENMMHAVTGISGSGPAYIFMVIEALADGGVRNGLPRATAMELAINTLKGAAEMCRSSKLHPGILKDQVCSPEGTTIAAVSSLEANGMRSAFIEAVTAASNRSKELSKI